MAYWIFKYKPRVFRLDQRVQDPNPTITWGVPQYTQRVRSGDVAFIWESGPKRGIRAAMQIDRAPTIMDELESERQYYVEPPSDEGTRILKKQSRVVGQLIARHLNLPMYELRILPGLETLTAFLPVRQTVFAVKQTEGDLLGCLAGLE